MKKSMIVFVAGSSATGKTTLVKGLINDASSIFARCITTTTRPKRPGEKQHKDYHFLSDTAFTQMENEGLFLETATIAEHRYGTQRKDLEKLLRKAKIILLIVDIQGISQLKKVLPEAKLLWLTTKKSHIIKRLAIRGAEKKDIQLRIKRIKREQTFAKHADIVIDTSHRSITQTCAFAKKSLLSLQKNSA